MSERPLPPELLNIPSITATRWLQIGPPTHGFGSVEGAEFDRGGNLICGHSPLPTNEILKVSMDGSVQCLYSQDFGHIIGIAIHADGRIFLADIKGKLLVLSPDGVNERDLLSFPGAPAIHPNDLCFDSHGDLFVTDFHEEPLEYEGGIIKFASAQDYSISRKIVGRLMTPNGIGLSPDEHVLWSTETVPNDVVRCLLTPEHDLVPRFFGVKRVYHASGSDTCDSLKVDDEGNVYIAMKYGGRCIVLNPNGVPIANVLTEDRNEGGCLQTPNLAIHPFDNVGYLLASGIDGAWIYRFETLAPARHMYAFS